MARAYVPLYFSYAEQLAMLPDDERGRLILALLEYAQTGAVPSFAPASATAMLFSCMRSQTDRDVEKYADICAKNRQNVNSRWKKHDTTVCDGIRLNTNDTKEKEKEKEKEKDLFAQFWAAYPKRKDKAKAQKAFAKLHPNEQLLAEILAALDWQKQSPDWLKDGGQFVPYAYARIVPARISKANVRILPDCYDEYADTVLRQIKIFCVQHARVYLISEIAQRIVEFTVRHVMFAVEDGGDVLPHDDFRLRLRNEFDIVPHQACLYYPIPNSQVRRRS